MRCLRGVLGVRGGGLIRVVVTYLDMSWEV